MNETERAKQATAAFLIKKFSEYYANADLIYPERFGRREYGFMLFDKPGMIRHIGFSQRSEIRQFLIQRSPMHAYYSSAYYERPDAGTMVEKKWLGADLIFDLDADHIEGAESMDYKTMLALVKKETLRLLEDFLLPDFGFDESTIKIAFSGGRGYHIHVYDPRVQKLSSHERREIIDYVTGVGINVDAIIEEKPAYEERFRQHTVVKTRVEMPQPDEPGWRGKMARSIIRYLCELEKMKKEDAIASLISSQSLSADIAEDLYQVLFEKRGADGERGVDKVKKGNLDLLKGMRKEFWLNVAKKEAVAAAGETDEPVTADVKRLIRLPASLHGKTGFKVVDMDVNGLKTFEPLRDALAFPGDEMTIRSEKETKLEFYDTAYLIKPGENTLPEYAAIFAFCRGIGRVTKN